MPTRFTIVRPLGSGGQGRVVAVRDAARADAVVALKETRGREVAGLKREFGLLARLRHPNLVAVYDWFDASPLAGDSAEQAPAAYTQELVEGVDLWRALRSADRAQRELVFEQVLRALAYLHALGVVHLDLKPENVLVSRGDGEPLARVLDFGIARGIHETSDAVRGSFSYIAPETLAGGQVDQRADLYALGIMMTEVACGRPPAREQLRGALAGREARRAWLADQGVPDAWLPLVTGLTSPHPDDRPRTAREAALLWARGRRRTVVLHTPGTVAAMVRAGPPAGRERELARGAEAVAGGGALVLTGTLGAGRRTAARAIARDAQIAGHRVETWPHGPPSMRGLGAALARLLGDAGVTALVSQTAGSPPTPAAGVPGRQDDAGRFAAWVDEAATAICAGLVALRSPTPRPLLVVRGLEALPRLAQAVITRLVTRAEGGERLPLGLVVTADGHDGPSAAPLAPLDGDAVRDFVTSRFGAGAADRRLCAALAAASGGHPLHLETLVALLVARKELALGGGGGWEWRGDAARMTLPDGMTAAIEARLDLLDPAARQTLGAVVWLRFPATADAVGAVLDAREPPLATLLELAAAGLLWRDPRERFRPAHPSLASRLEGWRPSDLPATHARVLALGTLTALSRAWHVGSDEGAALALAEGQARWVEGQVERAAVALDLALELAPGSAEALALRAEVANLLGPRELQVRCLEALLARLPLDDHRTLQAKSRLFWTLTRIGDAERAEAAGRELVALARARSERDILTEALILLAITHTQRGEYDTSERLLDEAGAAAAADALGLRARIANNLGNVHAYREDHEAALRCYGQAYRLKTEEGDPVGQRIAVGNMGLTCLHLGRLAEAQGYFAKSYAAARQTGHRRGEAWSLVGLSMLGLSAGALRYARRRAVLALAVADGLGDQLVACDAETTLAECLAAEGDRVAARARARSGLERAVAVKNGYTAARARLLLAADDLREQPAHSRRAAAAIEADTVADELTRARAAALVGSAALELGDLDGAAAAARRALDSARGRTSPDVLARAVETLRLVGDVRAAISARERALSELDALEASWPAAPQSDGVDDEAGIDGPSRATFAARPPVRALREATIAAGETSGGVAMATTEQVGEGPGALPGWLAAALGGDVAGLVAAIERWLADAVEAWGAERGFLVVGDKQIVAARDADGEAVTDAARKLPEVAVSRARAASAPWTASGASGRGSVLGLPLAVGGVVDAVLVMQNRFVPDAFAPRAASPPDLTPLAALLRVWGLEQALAEARARVAAAEVERREAQTRSTEEILSLRRELESTREQLGPVHSYDEIVFASTGMKRMLRQVDRVVETDLPVYIHGESGTGKELVAQRSTETGAAPAGRS